MLKHSPRFKFVETDAEAILYDTQTHHVIYLDPAAVIVWQLCDGARDEADIERLIGDAYPESRIAVSSDVPKTIARLLEEGALYR